MCLELRMSALTKTDITLMVILFVLAFVVSLLRRQVIIYQKRNANLVRFIEWKASKHSNTKKESASASEHVTDVPKKESASASEHVTKVPKKESTSASEPVAEISE